MSAARVYRPTPTVHGAGRLRSSVGGFGKYRTALQLGFDTAITGMLATYIRELLPRDSPVSFAYANHRDAVQCYALA